MRKKKKKEFSKQILIIVSAFTFIVSVVAMAIAWRTGDTSVFAYLIPSLFAELATATGFYYNKAKAENKIKIQKSVTPVTEESEE